MTERIPTSPLMQDSEYEFLNPTKELLNLLEELEEEEDVGSNDLNNVKKSYILIFKIVN